MLQESQAEIQINNKYYWEHSLERMFFKYKTNINFVENYKLESVIDFNRFEIQTTMEGKIIVTDKEKEIEFCFDGY